MNKTYYISSASQSGKFNFVMDKKKYSEQDFNDLLKLKILELIGEQLDQYDNVHSQVIEGLNSKKPVTILSSCFEIKFSKAKVSS